jgi:hypothetical protein
MLGMDRRRRWDGNVTCSGVGRGAQSVWVGKHQWKRIFERPRLRCEDNIKLGLQEIDWGSRLYWSGSGEVAGFCTHGNEPLGFHKIRGFLGWLRTCRLLTKNSSAWSEFVKIWMGIGITSERWQKKPLGIPGRFRWVLAIPFTDWATAAQERYSANCLSH